MYKHARVLPNWFDCTNDVFANIPNTPDVVFVDNSHREVLILEVGCVFDLYMHSTTNSLSINLYLITSLGYRCRFSVLIFGSLGHVHKLTMTGLTIAGMRKSGAKQLARHCSVSAVLGSLFVWRRRCHMYP